MDRSIAPAAIQVAFSPLLVRRKGCRPPFRSFGDKDIRGGSALKVHTGRGMNFESVNSGDHAKFVYLCMEISGCAIDRGGSYSQAQEMNIPSKLIEEATEAFASLPGIGKKTALRLVLHLLKEEEEFTEHFVGVIRSFRKNIKRCEICFNISDHDQCSICSHPGRDRSTVCVVENIRDLMAIESTGLYKGVYHVLGGVISPIDGVGPEMLNIHSLIERAESGAIREVIMAISPTIEGETTIYYLSRQLESKLEIITQIARGVSFGGELEYADELTLARSIADRQPYSKNVTSTG